MFELIDFIKIVAVSQIILILLLLLLSYVIKVFFYYRSRYYGRLTKKIEAYLTHHLNQSNEFTLEPLIRYKKISPLFISIITKFDASNKSKRWQTMRDQIINTILLPQVEILSQSTRWTNRYLACQILQLSSDQNHSSLLKTLIQDRRPLVSINAAGLAMNYNSQILIDAVIDQFSKGRRVQQSLFTHIISSAASSFIPLVENRLKREQDPYVRTFCYRILISHPCILETMDTVIHDLNSTTLDLKLAALAYLAHNEGKLAGNVICQYVTDPDWEVRAKAVKLLGDIQDETHAHLLEECLRDSQWWVRINAADSLVKLGKKGIQILENQKESVDQYAFDVARQILSTN